MEKIYDRISLRRIGVISRRKKYTVFPCVSKNITVVKCVNNCNTIITLSTLYLALESRSGTYKKDDEQKGILNALNHMTEDINDDSTAPRESDRKFAN